MPVSNNIVGPGKQKFYVLGNPTLPSKISPTLYMFIFKMFEKWFQMNEEVNEFGPKWRKNRIFGPIVVYITIYVPHKPSFRRLRHRLLQYCA